MTTPRTPNLVLRAWREIHGMTRSQMADALNGTPVGEQHLLRCDHKLIAKWESGDIRWPSSRYRSALLDLTGYVAAALGFTSPAPRTRHGQPPADRAAATFPAVSPPISPGLPLAETDLHAIDDLAALASALHARGYATSLATSLPLLIVRHPKVGDPQHINATGPCFCWGEIPFSQRPPTTSLTITADAVDVLMGRAVARQQGTS